MQRKNIQNKLVTFGIILILVFTIFSISNTASAEVFIDEKDGFFLDNFKDVNETRILRSTLDGCVQSDGTITLATTSDEGKYNFKKQANHVAKYYKSTDFPPMISNPGLHRLLETPFPWLGIYDIDDEDEVSFGKENISSADQKVIHHFRFKVEEDQDSLDQINIEWVGLGDKISTVKIYYWAYIDILKEIPLEFYGTWLLGKTITNSGTEENVTAKISKTILDNYRVISRAKNIDIAIVATPLDGEVCYLETDYIEVSTNEPTYETDGTAIVDGAVTPTNLFSWEFCTWSDYTPESTSILYQILDNDEELIPDEYLPGNSDGFDEPRIYLSLIPADEYPKLRIKANLHTDDDQVTPLIFNWALTWQTKNDTWQDLFNSDLRIDKKENIVQDKEDGSITLSSAIIGWGMFGKNPGNTRATTSPGPDEFNLYWRYKPDKSHPDTVGGGLCSPIVVDDSLFIASESGETYEFNTLVGDEYRPPINKSITYGHTVVNSPAVTNNLVAVATGSKDVQNRILVFDRDNSLELLWYYMDDDQTCYYASPVIHNNKLYICAWNGISGRYSAENGHNKLLTIDLETQEIWQKELPAASFCSPAVHDSIIIAGCDNVGNDSLFAFNEITGIKLWNVSVGALGRASPIIHDNKVYVITRERSGLTKWSAKVVAVDLYTGELIWNTTIGSPVGMLRFSDDIEVYDIISSSPTVYGNSIYVGSPDGNIYSLDVETGEKKWSKQVYTPGLVGSKPLISSPVYANGRIYITNPDGKISYLSASEGTESVIIPTIETEILSSPIIVNGLIYVCDDESNLLAIGTLQSEQQQDFIGKIVSAPIQVPSGYWWNRFQVNYTSNSTLGNIVQYSLLDESYNVLEDEIVHNDSIILAARNVVRISAELLTNNSIYLPLLHDWNISFETDSEPVFDEDSFTPSPKGWISSNKPNCTINVTDTGSGFLFDSSSPRVWINYTQDGETESESKWYSVTSFTGENGSKESILIANIEELEIRENISINQLHQIRFSITDLAGNIVNSDVKNLKVDDDAPTSYISDDGILEKYNVSEVKLTAIVSDATSEVARIKLMYRYSGDNDFPADSSGWAEYGTDEKSPWKWDFTDKEAAGGGYYQLSSQAIDLAGNIEALPTTGDVTFLMDSISPEVDFDESYWFNEIPSFTIDFSDDFKLESVEYRPNIDSKWTEVADDINSKIYDDKWSLKSSYWTDMNENTEYYIYFRVIDSSGNTYETSNDRDALIVVKDTTAPTVDINLSDFTVDIFDGENFEITASFYDGDGSGVKEIQLYYRYSLDQTSWTDWITYGETQDISPFEWNFTAENGSGYYQFKVYSEDLAGNVAESEVFTASVSQFPIIEIAAMIVVAVIFVIIVIIAFVLMKKKKEL